MTESAAQDLIPHPDSIRVRGRDFGAAEVIELLAPFLSNDRRERIDEVLANRTYTVVPVVEGVYDMGNVSAVMRSAEALGYQSVHVVESGEDFKSSSRTAQGSDKWLDVSRWPSSVACATELKRRGYRIVVTHLQASKRLEEIDFTLPTALVFGNEAEGVSGEMLSLADDRCIIPMLGFVESFNISVAAAIALHHAFRQRVAKLGSQGDLDASTLERLKAEFYMRSVKEAPAILHRLSLDKTDRNEI